MNHIVFLDPKTGELEKILSGVKSMLIKELNTGSIEPHPVHCGDTLYFLRSDIDDSLRVKAHVVRVYPMTHDPENDLPSLLKELQMELQLTSEQFTFWTNQDEMLLIEFKAAQKIVPIRLDKQKITKKSNWIPFGDPQEIAKEEVQYGQ
jgi:hypothetical protein